jgi:hypothetical protein
VQVAIYVPSFIETTPEMLQVLILTPVSVMRYDLVQFSWCLDSSGDSSSDDDSEIESNLARKSTAKSKPCKTCLFC